MKRLICILFCLLEALLTSWGQDSLSNKHSWSLAAGVNIIYPSIKEYIRKSQYVNPSYGYDFTVKPQSSVSPWFQLHYNHHIYLRESSFISLHAGIGYLQFKYKTVASGWYIQDFFPFGDSGVFNTTDKIHYGELVMGISSNIKIKKSVWYNKIIGDLDYQIGESKIRAEEKNIYAPIYNTNTINCYLSYQTGFDFSLCNQFDISPTILFPLISFNSIFNNNTNYINPFNNIKAGIILTYTKTKKQ